MHQLAPEGAVADRNVERHLDPAETAAYVDGAVADDRRRTLEAHLADCAECRAEVVEVSRIARTLPGAARRHLWIPAAAAAAVVLMFAWPRTTREPTLAHREAPISATIVPRTLAPVGTVDSATTITWSSVPRADRYHVRVFDADGSARWERETTDTVAVLPPSVRLTAGRAYFWKVEASIGFDRRVASDLVEFSVRRTGAP